MGVAVGGEGPKGVPSVAVRRVRLQLSGDLMSPHDATDVCNNSAALLQQERDGCTHTHTHSHSHSHSHTHTAPSSSLLLERCLLF